MKNTAATVITCTLTTAKVAKMNAYDLIEAYECYLDDEPWNGQELTSYHADKILAELDWRNSR